ncbi:putative 1-phosphatidylinositol 3-phosphate 5-kinase isoform X2 [Plodia interpunctella]|uniref:putative 1-phosphatidylinositol 3-phosphate 5-kinase isoform X2 n=1 Tax=Plodia interpunctella TaxID=58824 RepID=UPI002367ACB8|nr:putative 1-phosphatidylinositol 3-phosphate 5-kinase isoform X2 [Plodia interpunctella]
MDKYDTSQLTEFPRFEPESSQSGVSTFFSKLLKFPIFSPSETSENLQEKVDSEEKQETPQSEDQSKQDDEDTKTEIGSYAVEFEGRSLPNVLKRISSLVAMGSGGGTRYADTELARYWMPDDISRECYECAARFSTLRRRHHCRVCGQIFCSRCCSQRVPGQIFGCADGLRVCNYCCNIVLSYLRENDMTGDISPDLRTLQENLQVKFPDNKTQSNSNKGRQKFMFAREQDERCEPRATPKENLQDVYRQLSFSLPTQQHRYRLVRYNGVWRGCDILQWIMDNTSNKTRVQANQICQNLLQAGYMECVSELPSFADYALYRGTVLPPTMSTEDEKQDEECTRLAESVSSYCLDLNLDNNSARLIKAPKTEVKSSPSSEEDNPVLGTNEGYTETIKISKAISECGEEHLKLLMRQCVAREGLPACWLPILYPLCQQAADIIMPEMHSSDMDVRHYVQVKKVTGGAPRDCCLLRGLVLTKNVAHRGMPQEISNPTILLLDCSIAYQRMEGKLTSLEPVLLQEEQYLVRCAARICALRADVVLVSGATARGVQHALCGARVSLVAHVPARALRRAQRCTRADLLTSLDARIGTPRLGSAKKFYVKNYSSKTLMILEDCAEPNLGCCILLRGASLQELIRVKKVVKFMLLACYNWKLERAFLGDIEATLPEPGMTFEDDDNENDDKNDKNYDKDDIFDTNNDVTETKTDLTDKINVLINVEEDDSKMFTSESCDDPLQKKSYTRKTDSEKNFSGVPIQDFSDPLHSRLSVDDEVFLPKEEVILKADDTHTDRWTTDDVVLSMSPNVIIPAPYLETEAGKRCSLRAYLPRVSAASQPRVTPHTPKSEQRRLSRPNQPSVVLKEMHPFIKNPITSPADDPANKAALAHFRATGCRLVTDKHKLQCPLYKPSVIKKNHKLVELEVEPEKQEEPLDPLTPENHQRLSLLLYSYSNKSANVPDFCVNPWIVTMEMYGRHDISLGAFLEKYCFNSDYKCPSTNCQVPMNQHIRRFVHGDVCITISCNTIGHSNVDKLKEESSKQIMFWSRCQRCGSHGRARRVSESARALSLSAYLRLRVSALRYARARVCAHALNAQTHAFVKGLTTACFRYSKISTYDIELPPEVIATRYDTKQMRDALIQQLNELMHKGHETFSGFSDSEADVDYQSFKQHMEHIHLVLTAASLSEQNSLAAVVRCLWSVSDRIITGEKMLRDAQDKWSTPASKASKQTVDNSVEEKEKDKSDLEDSAGEGTEDNSKDEKEYTTSTAAEEDEEKGDKKTVRQILSQLLSNNQPSHQSGIIISGGAVPVVVAAGEIGSVIAATLASVAYQRSLRNSAQPECEDSENGGSSRDKADGEKFNKATKTNDHFEVLLKDGLLCRVYYPQQFQKLRHMLLAPLNSNPHIADEFARQHDRITGEKCGCEDSKENKNLCDVEEGFIRSLAHCVPWAARGGKSGSTFCKTEDDRYVLKEMTKPEWQQFLEFAPHYFNYLINCHQNKQPSLLARILGVYSVGGAGNGVLVMENIWYSCSPKAKRFDLKGSSRHRLITDTQPLSILMDENLLNLRWETQLYVQSHVGSVIWTCIERDTTFLAQHAVMDYSLLLGIDDNKLVLGVVDYIRTFTWDKKLEHLVKKNLGSGSPTVVSPADYKRRFSIACRKYFLQCPDHWDHLTNTIYA